ncbi:ABC transporter permease [Labilibacter marinus]|uniref:ABC transporter permease n=1 Tax=Labilibacter marinus TaxID=1477105 RepID=UPI00094F8BE7|nr:ABC transporter permease [Labilibacter marinus]
MFDLDKWQEIFYTLKKNKLRTFLTGFGVFWGIFMLMLMMGAGKGLENGVYANMGDFATNSMFVWTQPTSKPYKGFPRNRRYYFKYEDKQAMKDNIAGIDIIAPRMQGGGYQNASLVSRGLQEGSYEVTGIIPEDYKIDPVSIKHGRFINEMDLKGNRKVAIIGKTVYNDLFEKDEDPLNKYIRIGEIYFQVIGTYESKHSQRWGEQQNQTVFIPFSTCQVVYNYNNIVGYFAITAKPEYDIMKVEKEVKALLAKRHDIHPEDEGAMGSNNVGEEFKKMSGLFLGINILVWIVGIGTLLAGVIGISNIMLIIIKERTQEIGIKRAIGASPLNIISTIITESVFLTGLAGFLGMFFGVLIVEGISQAIGSNPSADSGFLNPEVNFTVAVTSLLILIFSGVLAGVIPSRRAVAIKPIEAIRQEN